MIVINFSNSDYYLRGKLLRDGFNIDNTNTITEADRNELIGIGESDFKHYKNIMDLFNIVGVFINQDSNYLAIVSIYERIQSNKALLKREAFENSKESMQNNNRHANISRINNQINKDIELIKYYLSKITQESLNENVIARVQDKLKEIQNYPHKFKLTEIANEIFSEIVSTKKQHLGYDLTLIKKDLGV